VSAPTPTASVLDGLTVLRDELAGLDLALPAPSVQDARAARDEIVAQVDDYVLPRLRAMEAPLLVVVGGSTGAGKSTLVNSLVGAEVSPASVLRPTTRVPVLVCHPDDLEWFTDDRVLPGLARTTGARADESRALELVPTQAMPAGLAILDAPDIDSVVVENRALARQLLAAADMWLFVTTAARYADAVPWDLLHGARERGTALSLVLNRVPPGAEEEVESHLRELLAEHGIAAMDLRVVRETELADGRLPAEDPEPVRRWLSELAGDAAARSAVVRRTLEGALASLLTRVPPIVTAVEEQTATVAALEGEVERAYATAAEEVDEAVKSGSLLREEVLARWQELVGTGELMRALEVRIGRVRDRVRSFVTGAPVAEEEVKAAIETSVETVVLAAADRAAERVVATWQHDAAGRALVEGARRLDAASEELAERTEDAVRRWQGHVLELVREEGASKRTSARIASVGVNALGLAVMLAVFAHTGGLTGGEVAVAGGTSALSQKVLEAIFGDQAVRSLAARARTDLLARVERLLAGDAERFRLLLAPYTRDAAARDRLVAALDGLARAR
jgi:energy-coupling factor transporter ATP-binding protein EcfA2